MNLIKKIKQSIEDKKEAVENMNYRYHSIISQVLPVYHDRFRTTNKNTIKITADDDRMTKVNLESQDGTIIKFHKDFDNSSSGGFGKHTGLPSFQKDGIEYGMIVNINGNGFLENENSVYEVILLTDRFVYMRNLQYNSIYPHSYEEIERMKSLRAFEITQ